MQRIALLGGLVLCFALAGCAPTSSRDIAPLPQPQMRTRAPQPVQPIAPPQARSNDTDDSAETQINIDALRPPGGIRRNWTTIVVHHSAAASATPQGMDSWHRQRGWENGLGYHFVIGNGVNYGDGRIFVGPRWRKQIQGAHCASSSGRYFGKWRTGGYFNEQGIGICLIGDFDHGQPTRRQLAALKTLIRYLCNETGVSTASIFGHGEITGKTACPGKLLSMRALRQSVALGQPLDFETFANALANDVILDDLLPGSLLEAGADVASNE